MTWIKPLFCVLKNTIYMLADGERYLSISFCIFIFVSSQNKRKLNYKILIFSDEIEIVRLISMVIQ